jgi:hypothetical protein
MPQGKRVFLRQFGGNDHELSLKLRGLVAPVMSPLSLPPRTTTCFDNPQRRLRAGTLRA